MKIVITGGSGFVGKALVNQLLEKGHELVILTRSSQSQSESRVKWVAWDGKSVGSWAEEINGADAVIHLAGESVAAKRWTDIQKQKIRDSRVEGTQAIVQAIQQATQKPEVLINASAVGYYGSVEDGDVVESSPKGTDFLAKTCQEWEVAAQEVEKAGVRLVRLRIGVVLEKGGGAMGRMIPPFSLFMGGPLGNGKQWFPWIHRDDVIGMILFSLENKNVSGALNTTAPQPLRMKDFCLELGKAMKRPSWAPVPKFALQLLLGDMAHMLTTGQKVIPQRAQELGYRFKYEAADQALSAIFR